MSRKQLGLLLAFTTYILWGLLSLYWKLLVDISPYSIFSYRILFTVLTMVIYMLLSGKSTNYTKGIREVFSTKTLLMKMAMASFLISVNWLVYIFAVSHGLATQASLGYYILPIVSVLLAMIFLREKISKTTFIAILLAACGVLNLVLQSSQVPWIALILASSFAFYGLIKKKVTLSSDLAMLIESLVIAPFALIYLIGIAHDSFFQYSLGQQILLMISGIVTAIPLLLFAEALKRAELNQVGFVQYINPTIQLLIAIFCFGEEMSSASLHGFIFIWIAILVFVLGQFNVIKNKFL